jgi:molybdenum-dependent DNA-binding transcriptional regulator ModE
MDWAERIGRRIRFRDLHVLLAVAEHGSMSKASAELAISHPVVSKTISDLERTLGVRLFDRSSQGVELTDYGRALLECGVSVFDEMRRGLKRIEFLTDPQLRRVARRLPRDHHGRPDAGHRRAVLAPIPRHPLARCASEYSNAAIPGFAGAQGRSADRKTAAAARGR